LLTEERIIDDDGKDVSGFDTVRELCLRGPTVTSGYFENPKANAESFDSEGFFKTGDIGYCDGKSKKWYIIDRKKELIKVRAFQVAPPEIEGVLLSHPHIVDAAVIVGIGGEPIFYFRLSHDTSPKTICPLPKYLNRATADSPVT
jgi:acyl-CoA synthetase (AMP-forming)/AMP-acid ligase II